MNFLILQMMNLFCYMMYLFGICTNYKHVSHNVYFHACNVSFLTCIVPFISYIVPFLTYIDNFRCCWVMKMRQTARRRPNYIEMSQFIGVYLTRYLSMYHRITWLRWRAQVVRAPNQLEHSQPFGTQACHIRKSSTFFELTFHHLSLIHI